MSDSVTTYPVELRHLQAMLHLAAENDIREQLNGVWLHSTPTRQVLISSNGLCLGAMPTLAARPVAPSADIFIPRKVITGLPKLKAGKGAVVEIDPAGKANTQGHTVSWTPGEDNCLFSWRPVFPRECDHEAGHLDINLLALFVKVNKTLGSSQYVSGRLHITHHNRTSAIVRLVNHPGFVGVCMCLRESATEGIQSLLPDWLTESNAADAAGDLV